MAAKNQVRRYIIIVLIVVITIGLIIIAVKKPAERSYRKEQFTAQPQQVAEPKFRYDGDLIFSSNTKVLKIISIEIARTDATREQGLMYRKAMPDSCGMLFIFDEMQPLDFWMKNTALPLDIIYIDDKFSIVSIAKNAVPFSETSIPSGKDAMYVVEVNGGFTDKYHIVKGNTISYTANNLP